MSSGFSLTANQLGGLQAGLGLGSGIAQIAGTIGASNRAKEAGQRAIEAAEANAALLELQGIEAKAETARASRRLISAQRVAFAKNGVNVGTGSALLAALDQTTEGAVAALRAQFGFDSQAYQERVKGILAAFGAESSASSILTTGVTTGSSTILGGAIRGLGTANKISTVPTSDLSTSAGRGVAGSSAVRVP